MVSAVKVSQSDGQCTIKVTNVHPTRSMVDQVRAGSPYSQPDRSLPFEADWMMSEQYMVGFVVFNAE